MIFKAMAGSIIMFAYAIYLLAFLSGFVVKIVDWFDDDLKSKHPAKYIFAILYGAAIGYLISASPFSMLFLGAMFAQVFARKVDTLAHQLGFVVSLIAIILFGFPQLDLVLFVCFMVAAFLDEIEHINILRPIMTYRPFLPVAALLVGLATGQLDYLAGVLVFDVGYLIAPMIAKKFQPI